MLPGGVLTVAEMTRFYAFVGNFDFKSLSAAKFLISIRDGGAPCICY